MADDTDDCDRGLAGLSPEFQAMVGGLAGHTASFAKMLEKRSKAISKEEEKNKDDDTYLESYADLAIHEDMLKDTARVEAYRMAIAAYSSKWKEHGNVTVVDVGSGTGLLAILAAQAGARRVVAVEASRLAHFLKQVVSANQSTEVVEVRECRAEELELDGDAKAVDVIVSEWMGYFLLFENMLPSVLSVRDRYLRQGGLMLPSACRLLIAPIEDDAWMSSKLSFWKNVHGIDMSALLPLAEATFCGQAQHREVISSALIGPAIEVLNLDLATVKAADLMRFEQSLAFEVPAGRRLDGFVSWFECEFGDAGWLLSTSPSSPVTHWRQTAFYLKNRMEGGGGGVKVEGKIVAETHEEFSRGYRVTFELSAPARKRRIESFELR